MEHLFFGWLLHVNISSISPKYSRFMSDRVYVPNASPGLAIDVDELAGTVSLSSNPVHPHLMFRQIPCILPSPCNYFGPWFNHLGYKGADAHWYCTTSFRIVSPEPGVISLQILLPYSHPLYMGYNQSAANEPAVNGSAIVVGTLAEFEDGKYLWNIYPSDVTGYYM